MRLLAHHVIHTKLIPPPRSPRAVTRPRVTQALQEALEYRATILQAGAGYGKSTALAELAAQVQPLIWYQVNEEDGDPPVFLLHLCYAIQRAFPNIQGLPIALIEGWDGDRGPLPWRSMVDQVINVLSDALTAPTLLAFDDVHLALHSREIVQLLDRLITLAPAHLHTLLAGRPSITLPGQKRWRTHGDLLVLDHEALAFTLPEIMTLFAEQYQRVLSAAEGRALLTYTEGWAIALQLIWQKMRAQHFSLLDLSRNAKSASLDELFDLLAQEVFAGEPEYIRRFLLISATLRDLAPDACNALRAAVGDASNDSVAMLTYLREHDLFVVETQDAALRYHHIFHNFLRQQAPAEERRRWHRAAANYFADRQQIEATIYHLFEAQDWQDAADLLDVYSDGLITAGRLDTLSAYLDALPVEVLREHPMLMLTLGKLDRLRSRFAEAMRWYQQAEMIWRARQQMDGVARALRGQARVYLDTVNPTKAEQLLEEAIRLSDGIADREAQVRLFEMLAENKLNAGRVDEAERLRRRAESLRLSGPSNDELWFRVLLRTGRLRDALAALQERAAAERKSPVQTPRAHRETLLLLSLIHALRGETEAAQQTAVEGTQRGEALNSPFITAVGYIRQGHAAQLASTYRTRAEDYARARVYYEKSIELSRILSVPRLRVEAGWGLCRTYGYAGDLNSALTYANESIEIAVQAGDEWIASLVRLTLGASYALAGEYEQAQLWLQRAATGFLECSDPFGYAAARLWLAFKHFRCQQMESLAQLLPDLLAVCSANGYDFLWTQPTLIGAPDERIFVPLLLYALRQGWEEAYVIHLLDAMHLSRTELHPGYQLRVQTLGRFCVWRGDEPIPANGWRRRPARLLFQLLLTHRHALLEREQICEALWPEADPSTALQNFKIALNALYSVLEPGRKAGAESAYVLRDGASYGLRPNADIWIDADHFVRETRSARNDPAQLQRALALYQGEYLPDARYETWAAGERERLATIFLESADRLVEHLLDRAHFVQVIDLCQRILAQDNCWERAYRHLMSAYHGLGDHGQIARTYQRCVQTLREELDVAPAPETEALYARLRSG